MKKLTLILLAFSFCSLKAQNNNEWGIPYNETKKAFIYEEVVQQPGVSKDELYKRANDWIASYIINYKQKITETNQENGIIKLRQKISLVKEVKKDKVEGGQIEFHLDIELKDGKYRYSVYKFMNYKDANSQPIEKWMDANHYKPEASKADYGLINNRIEEMLNNMKAFMKTGKIEKKDNW